MKTDTQRNRKYWNKNIKEDRWWDFSFFLKMMEHKLNHMILNWDKSHYEDAHEDKAKMIEVKNALKLFREDNFMDKYTPDIDAKYGKYEIFFKEIPNTDGSGELLTYRNGEPESEEAELVYREAIKKAQIDKDKCKDFIFDTLKNEIENWWD